MLEAVTTDLVFTISLKRSTQNLQLSTSLPADYPIYWHLADIPTAPVFVRFWTKADKGQSWPGIVCLRMTHSGHRT